jgi:hypothetical protein
LELEPQEFREPLLGGADGAGGLAAGPGPFVGRGHEFVEDGVVVGEQPVEGLVVVGPAEVNRRHQVDGHRFSAGPGRRPGVLGVGHDRGVERLQSASGVAGEPEELDRFGDVAFPVGGRLPGPSAQAAGEAGKQGKREKGSEAARHVGHG